MAFPQNTLSQRNNLHYALIYLDSSENIRVEVSSALHNVDDEFFITPEVRRKFYDLVKKNTRSELFRLSKYSLSNCYVHALNRTPLL